MGQPIVNQRFKSRNDAGFLLTKRLSEYKGRDDVLVLALPRGGVPVAFEIAVGLGVPLDVQMVRKLGVPSQRELAFGAIASGDVSVFNRSLVSKLKLSDDEIRHVVERERAELARREQIYRADLDAPVLKGKTVILVDDGLATGATMRAAVDSVKKERPSQIVVAVPVAAPDICREFESDEDIKCVCLIMPEPLYGVGLWYEDFSQTTDQEVCGLLEELRRRPIAGRTG